MKFNKNKKNINKLNVNNDIRIHFDKRNDK